MKRIARYTILTAASVFALCACEKFLDTRIDVYDTQDRLETRYATLNNFADKVAIHIIFLGSF